MGEVAVDGGWVGGRGTLRRPRVSGFGQEAERVGGKV